MFEKEIDELKLNYEEALRRRENGEYKEAIESLYKALDIEPQNTDVLLQLAEVFSLMNDYERSLKYYSCALAVLPDNLNILSAAFDTAYKAGLYKDALDYAKRAFEMEKSSRNYMHMVKIIDKFGDIKSLRLLLNEPDISSEILFNIALVFIHHAFMHDAEAVLTRMPEDEYKSACEAVIKFNQGDVDSARRIVENVNIENDEIYNIKGLFSIDDLNLTDAIKYFLSAISLRPDEPRYYFNLANSYFYNGWLKEAEAAYRKAIGMDLENADYRFALANMYYEISEYAKAKQEVENIFKMDSEHLNAKVLNALLKYQKKDYLGAKSDLENALLFNPNNNYVNISLAKILLELGDYKKAEELILNVLSVEKDNLYAMSVFAKLLYYQDKCKEALEMVDCVLNKNKYYMDAFAIGMQAAFALDDEEAVKRYASGAISIDINYGTAYYYLAMLSYKEQDYEEAIECAKRAIMCDLNNPEYYILMAKIYEDSGDVKSALEYASEAVSIEGVKTEQMLYYSNLAQKNRNICQKK